MKTIKTMLLTIVLVTFALVWMSIGPSMQGMSFSVKMSNVANTTIEYLRQMLSPIMDFYYRYLV